MHRKSKPQPSLPLPQPTTRRLRIYAFDPNASLSRSSAKFSHATISLAWNDPTEDPVEPGPVNDYLEVIDIDPVSRQFYEPIDLNHKDVLAQDGLPPSEGDPRFHQQMIFAVAMKTIKLFERALGRKVTWRPEWDPKTKSYKPTQKLRVYPHALREANAYYSREKRALLFGYFKASQRMAGANWIFTALSHDIIVHETTHAILDGLHPRYSEATSLDSLAFHEAFADIAALFSHFQLTEAVHQHIERDGGGLNHSSLLSGLARQFAMGTSEKLALRDYIDEKHPDPDLLASTTEPHERGAILVAAVFDAFLTIYTARTEDLLRIAGVQPNMRQRLHPDLVTRLTKEAGKSADHVLRMCIRALDYLPPVDVRFGEFLRAIITADTDLIPDDRLNYRLAFVEAFRKRGIFPDNCLSLSPDNLMWSGPSLVNGLWNVANGESESADGDGIDGEDDAFNVDDVEGGGLDLTPRYRRHEVLDVSERNRRKIWYWLMQPELQYRHVGRASKKLRHSCRVRLTRFLNRVRSDLADIRSSEEISVFMASIDADLFWLGVSPEDRAELGQKLKRAGSYFRRYEVFRNLLCDETKTPRAKIWKELDERWEKELGIFFARSKGKNLWTIGGTGERPSIEVSSVRTTRRAGPDGQDIRQLVIEVTQRRQGYLYEQEQAQFDAQALSPRQKPPMGDFVFRGGATMIIDLRERKLRYVISKRIDDDRRLREQREFLLQPYGMGMTYDQSRSREPFALLHRG